MPRIIGLTTVWGAGPFVEPCIKQSLEFCDEMLAVVAPHHEKLKKFGDNSDDFFRQYSIKLVEPPLTNQPHDKWRAAALNKLLDSSSIKIGDWIYLIDVDEFFLKSDLEIARSKMNKCDCIRFEERYFVINMQKYVVKTSSPRLWRYDGGKFKPTTKWTNSFENIFTMPLSHGMFHYSLLMNPHAKIFFWDTERNRPQPHKSNWITDVYLKYDVNETKWLPGTYGGSFKSDNGNLFLYHGKHPEPIEEAGLPKIQDFRKLWVTNSYPKI